MNFELVHGDVLDVLRSMEDGSVDVVVTSPPYNQLQKLGKPSGMHAKTSGALGWLNKVAAIGYEDSKPEGLYQQWLCAVVSECLRVSRGLVWINHKMRYRNKEGIHPARFLPFPIYSEIIWDRGGSLVLNSRRFAPSHEVIYGFGKPHYWDNAANKKLSVWRIAPQISKIHPCPFPLELPLRLIAASCPPAGVVLDPFSGSGTTGVAALQLGRGYIGIDTSLKFLEASRERLLAVPQEIKKTA